MISTPSSGPASSLTLSATSFNESMSRPESVSSKIASEGSSTASCRTSFRFFSPPENPWFTYRWTIASSIPSRSICVFMCLRNASAEICSPLIAWYAVRRKFTTDTPGTSVGYCIARNNPRCARWSGVRVVMSSPLKTTLPSRIRYPGRPMITLESVDLPDPLGPISAWISPCCTVRSIPRRISRSPTAARKPSTCSVAGARTSFWLIWSHLDQDVVVVHGHGEHIHRLDGWERSSLAGVEVEGGPVLRTLDRLEIHVHLPLVQVVVLVRADRIDGAEPLVAEVHHGDQATIDGEAARLTFGHVIDRTHADRRGHQRTPSMDGSASSSWIASSALCRTSSRRTRSKTSWKKPVTMSRSASARGIPRLSR